MTACCSEYLDACRLFVYLKVSLGRRASLFVVSHSAKEHTEPSLAPVTSLLNRVVSPDPCMDAV